MSTDVPVIVVDKFACPSCQATVQVGRSAQGDMFFHPLPTCEVYVKLSAEDFAALVKRHRA